ncbi:hypothetical protein ACIPJS_13880 [Streptomyces sp. NPDC086783]|uniref:hypothetical protein n=1 Tax=Streptomyces sp. NPDC086783 TaxID=3365758 RepID=UPI00382A093B
MGRARVRRRSGAVAVAAASGVLLLGGCGIQETDVIEAGGPASIQAFFDDETEVLLFFHTRDGRLHPVIRPAESMTDTGSDGLTVAGQNSTATDTAPPPLEKVLAALLAGPGERDRKAGLGTSLHPTSPDPPPQVEVSASGKQVTADLPLPLDGLNRTASQQLICTVAYGHDADIRATVRLRGTDGTSRSGTCDFAPEPRPGL